MRHAMIRLLAAALIGAGATLIGGVAEAAPPAAWHVRSLHLAEAHRLARGAGVTVAVLDSSVQPHRDLRGALLPPIDAGPPRGRDDPGRGTALAGLIAARGDGRTGALGVAPEAGILPIRVGAKGFDASPDAVAAGIDRALGGGATVIVSTYSRIGVPEVLAAAVRRAIAADAVLIAPAGPGSPVAVTLADLPGVVSVAGADRDGRPERVSVRGLRLDVAAPAEGLVAPVRTSLEDGYAEVRGADYAAALVGGVAALVRSRFPRLSGADVARRLMPDGPRDMELGRGPVDASDALTRTIADLPAAAPRPGGPARDRQWYLDAIGVPDAHRITRGAGTVLGLVAPFTAANTDLGVAQEARVVTADGAADDAVRSLADRGADVILTPAVGAEAAAYALAHDAAVVTAGPAAPPGVLAVRGVRQRDPVPPGLVAPAETGASADPDLAAAALVAGVAVLVRAGHPKDDAATTTGRILSTATPFTDRPGYGRGVVNPVAALTADMPPADPPPAARPPGRAAPSRWFYAIPLILLGAVLIWALLRRRRLR